MGRKANPTAKKETAGHAERLTPAELLARNRRNIQIKLEQNKTLRVDEIALLRSEEAGAPEGGEETYVKTKAQLCAKLGFTRPRLDRWISKPGAPTARADGKHNVTAWRLFIGQSKEAKAEPGGTFPDVGKNGEQEELPLPNSAAERERVLKMREEREDAAFERKIKRGQYIDRGLMREAIRRANAKVEQELTRRFVSLAPEQYAHAKGDVNKCREINRGHIQELLAYLHSGEFHA